MSARLSGTGPKAPGPIAAFSWLDWQRDGTEYVGGDYRIRLIEAYRWEVLHGGEHLRFDERLSSALAQAEHHHIESLRRHDLWMWGLVLAGSILGGVLLESNVEFTELWALPLLALILYAGLSALVRLLAAATRDRYDPYRRRAPWERRDFWQRL